jgi:uncharacterized protein YjbJ (UPF0337 family)
MDKQRVKGAVDEVVGAAKRQVGDWTGNTKTQVEGTAQQIKGKVETAVGKLKDAARDARDNVVAQQQVEAEVEREQEDAVIVEHHKGR